MIAVVDAKPWCEQADAPRADFDVYWPGVGIRNLEPEEIQIVVSCDIAIGQNWNAASGHGRRRGYDQNARICERVVIEFAAVDFVEIRNPSTIECLEV